MFFEHENQPCPPSLSSDGNLRFGCKADLLACLENIVAAQTDCPAVDAIVLAATNYITLYSNSSLNQQQMTLLTSQT